MKDDQRVYSNEEFALILRTASELATGAEQPRSPSDGLTLTEMKSAAAQAGLDPVLVERAARLLVTRATASPFQRVIGGPLRHTQDVHVPVSLDEESAARLLSGIRISSPLRGQNAGHSSALGVTWDSSGEGDVLSVVARPDRSGTTISVVVDRRGTFALTCVVTSMAALLALLVSVGVYNEVSPLLGVATGSVGAGGVLAVARRFWGSSTRTARERLTRFVDAIGQALLQPEDRPAIAPEAPSVSRR
jgi:hypothetical protein